MWAFLLSTIGRWVIGGVLIDGVLGGGLWYVKHLQSSSDAWKRVAIEQRRVIEIYEKDQATDRATEEKKHEVDEATTPEQPDRYYDELRRRANGKRVIGKNCEPMFNCDDCGLSACTWGARHTYLDAKLANCLITFATTCDERKQRE